LSTSRTSSVTLPCRTKREHISAALPGQGLGVSLFAPFLDEAEYRQIYVEMAKAWMLAARLAGPDRTAAEDATASVYNFTANHF
jgi:hypothetical protein